MALIEISTYIINTEEIRLIDIKSESDIEIHFSQGVMAELFNEDAENFLQYIRKNQSKTIKDALKVKKTHSW